MVRDVASRAVSQSPEKQQRSDTWHGVICAAIVAGFEGYGSAMAGRGHSGSAIDDLEARGEECVATNPPKALTCSHPVAEVRSCSKSAATIWGYAGEF